MQADDATNPFRKPAAEPLPPLAARQKQDAKLNLTENDWIDGDFTFMAAKPELSSSIVLQPGSDFIMVAGHGELKGARFDEGENHANAL